jgi:hypothetical protein
MIKALARWTSAKAVLGHDKKVSFPTIILEGERRAGQLTLQSQIFFQLPTTTCRTIP